MHLTRHLAAALSAVAALGLAAGTAGGAAPAPALPAVPAVEAATTILGTLSVPDDLKNYTDISSMFRRQPLLGADGQPFWLYNRQLSSDDAKAWGVATANLAAAPSLDFSTISGSVALRSSDLSYDRWPFNSGQSAVGGATWVVDHRLTPRPARDQLVKVDDRLHEAGRIKSPKGISLAGAVATSRGLRLVGFEQQKSGRRTVSRVVVIDGKRVTRQKFITTVESAVALPDGSLLLAGVSAARTSLPTPVLRVSPSGKVSRMADRRAPSAAAFTGNALATKAGIAMLESSGGNGCCNSAEADVLKAAVVLRNAQGKVAQRRFFRELEYPKGACQREPITRSFGDLRLGADGLPVVRVVCSQLVDTQSGRRSDVSAVQLGLNEDLSVRWWRYAPEAFQSAGEGYRYTERCNSDSVDRNGRLLVIACNGSVYAVTVPGALPVTRGTISSTRRDGKKGAVARIVCRGDHGSVCSGVARVLVNGTVVGSVPYALPGRPGKAAATLDRHVPTSRELPKRFTVTLGV